MVHGLPPKTAMAGRFAALERAASVPLLMLVACGSPEDPPLIVVPEPLSVVVTPGTMTVPADARSTVDLTLEVTAGDGPAPDGVVVGLTAGGARIEGVGATEGGRATAVLVAGTIPGQPTLSLDGGTVTWASPVELTPLTSVSAALHLHGSMSEGVASMQQHTDEHREWGLDVLWWTDHDSMYGHPTRELGGFDFEDGALSAGAPWWPSKLTMIHTITEVASSFDEITSEATAAAARDSSYGWALSATASGGVDTAVYTVEKRVLRPLMGEVTFSAAVRREPEADPSSQLRIVIPLNKTRASVTLADEYDQIIFFDGPDDLTQDDDARTVHLPIGAVAGEWVTVSADLSALAAKHFALGTDQRVELFDVELAADDGQTAAYSLDDIAFDQRISFEDLRQVQVAFLDTLEAPPKQLVGHEVSHLDGGHLSVYGSGVPLIPLHDSDDWDPWSAVVYAHERGGVVSYNHPLGTDFSIYPDEEREEGVQRAIRTLTEAELYGCDLVEVIDHRGGILSDFTAIWDALGADGLFVTGVGASDRHDLDPPLEYYGQNMGSWVRTPSDAEDDLLWGMKRGAVVIGRPTAFEDAQVDATLVASPSGATMGQAVVATEDQVVTFSAAPLPVGWTVRWVVDGELREEGVVEDTAFVQSLTIDPVEDRIVRVEVYNDEEKGVLLTNPVYFVGADEAVPMERQPL